MDDSIARLYGFEEDVLLHVKWNHSGRWRRFALPKTGVEFKHFYEFLKFIEPKFHGGIGYIDDEGDFVHISSTSGIKELVYMYDLLKLKTIYLHSTSDDDDEETEGRFRKH